MKIRISYLPKEEEQVNDLIAVIKKLVNCYRVNRADANPPDKLFKQVYLFISTDNINT